MIYHHNSGHRLSTGFTPTVVAGGYIVGGRLGAQDNLCPTYLLYSRQLVMGHHANCTHKKYIEYISNKLLSHCITYLYADR
jgi:hypothetical protein